MLKGCSLRTPRAAAIAGILFALLLAAALVLVRLGAPPDAGETGAGLTDPSRRRLVAMALNLVPFAGIAFPWFIWVVRDRIRQREDRFFATVFLGSGLLFVGMLFVATAIAAGLLAGTAGRTGAPDDQRGNADAHRHALRHRPLFASGAPACPTGRCARGHRVAGHWRA